MKSLKGTAVLAAAFFLFPLIGRAEDAALAEKNKTLEERVAQLEQQVRLLTRVGEVSKEVQIKKDTETPVVQAGKDGFSLRSADQDFQIKFKGQVQADGRYFAGDDTATGVNQYLIRRLRPSIEGTVYKYFDFKLLTDFAGSTAAVQDAFIDFKYWKAASIRAGKFKSPMSLEALQSDANKMFVENSLVSNLVPNRDIGFDLHGDLFENRVSYDLAVMDGVADGASLDTDSHDDKDFVVRIFTHPFKNSANDWISGLGFGVAASTGRAHGSSSSSTLPSFRSPGQQTFFAYNSGVFADGEHNRINPQAYWFKGPIGLMSEWVVASQRVKADSASAATLTNYAWNIVGSYVATGEDSSYSGVIPRKNLDIKNGTWGALEFVSRLHQLKGDSDNYLVFANPTSAAKGATAWVIGFNWYLNKYVRIMTNFEQTLFNGGSASLGDRKNENAFLSRMQLGF